MSSSDFRQIAIQGEFGKGERLFRAAVTAFCSLTRPSRREVAQLEDLTLPLFDTVSADSLRYVAAALSECDFAPPALVRRLCEEDADIAAPLLMRSQVLTDVDLLALIGRHGESHARAVARRETLSPVIAGVVQSFDAAAGAQIPLQEDMPASLLPEKVTEMLEVEEGRTGETTAKPAAADAARERLRAMMRPVAGSAEPAPAPQLDSYAKLRETALTGHLPFFQTALADALGIDFRVARRITEEQGYGTLATALKALQLGEDRAFVIAAAVFPASFGHAEAVRLFLERYRLIHPGAAADRLRDWKAQSIAAIAARSTRPQAANEAFAEEGYDWSAEAQVKAS